MLIVTESDYAEEILKRLEKEPIGQFHIIGCVLVEEHQN